MAKRAKPAKPKPAKRVKPKSSRTTAGAVVRAVDEVSTREWLERARLAVTKQDFAAARDALTAAWRQRRSETLADLIDVVAERAPDALSAAITGLVTPRVITTRRNWRAIWHHDDPRLSRWAIDALVQLPFTTPTASGFLIDVIDVIGRTNDRRVLEKYDAITTGFATRLTPLSVMQKVARRFHAVMSSQTPVAETPAAEAALEEEIRRAIEPLRKVARSAEALLADIYANPEDDAPRLVLADLLLERGDPRGELITLQIERGHGAPSERETELLKKHGKLWMGSLAPVLSWGRGYAQTRFRRGFVAHADIILSVRRKLTLILRDPAWSTVESLEGALVWELLQHAPLRALRVIQRQLSADDVAQIAKRESPLSNVRRIWVRHPASHDGAILRAVFPGLTTVCMHKHSPGSDDLAALGALGVPRVEITNNWALEDVRQARTEFENYVGGLIGTPAPMPELALHPLEDDPLVELVRDGQGNFARKS